MGESKEEDVQASSVRSAASDPRRASGGGLVHPETVASQGGVSGEVRRGSVDADIPEGARERCEADRAAGRAAPKPTAERRNSVDADTPRDRDSNKKRAKLDLAEAERKEEEEKKPAVHDAHAPQEPAVLVFHGAEERRARGRDGADVLEDEEEDLAQADVLHGLQRAHRRSRTTACSVLMPS